eukprot:1658833-Amphidinium_carterae.1
MCFAYSMVFPRVIVLRAFVLLDCVGSSIGHPGKATCANVCAPFFCTSGKERSPQTGFSDSWFPPKAPFPIIYVPYWDYCEEEEEDLDLDHLDDSDELHEYDDDEAHSIAGQPSHFTSQPLK